MRFILGTIVVLVTLGAVLAAGTALYAHRAWVGPGPLTDTVNIVIPRGSGVSTIAARLEADGVIASALLFKIAVRLSADAGGLKAGEYEFAAHIAGRDVLDKLVRGAVVQRRITVPEGRTSWQVVQMLRAQPELEGEVDDIPPEGSLLPETYSFARGTSRNAIIAEMTSAMERTVAELWPGRAEGLPFTTIEEAIVLASIVEKETGVADERARIAGVFINRLRRGMLLQTDPTVIYAITEGQVREDGQGPLGRRLLRKDLEETDSPYNTYKYPGLPPGPIANPGRAAIEATLNPESHDYLYFVADGTGGHVFARTLAEHNRNAADWRRLRRATGQ